MITNLQFAEQAKNGGYIGIPYAKLDCQALLERVLKDCGYSYNWRGSNHMWRDALSEKYPILDWHEVPLGAWVFDVRRDGGEKSKGYNDNEGNAKHVGIYVGDNRIIHSTTGGVQWDSVTDSRWNWYGLCKYITYVFDYDEETEQPEKLTDILRKLNKSTIADILKACKEMGWI